MVKLSPFKSGFLLGFGTGFITRDVLSSGPSIFRPVVKGAIKTGIALANKTRESLIEMVENVEDLFAEIRSEHRVRSRTETHTSGQAHTKKKKTATHDHKAKG